VPLTDDQKRSIDYLRQTKGWGRRRIAKALGINEKPVRSYMERTDALSYPDPVPIRTVVWDLETTGLRSDIGTLLVGAFLDLATGETECRSIYDFTEPDTTDFPRGEVPIIVREGQLLRWCRQQFEAADILIGHNSIGFDKNFLNGVSARHQLPALPKRFHIDTLSVARYGMKGLLQSNSLENVADFFGVGVKNKPSKHDWRLANATDRDAINSLKVRCGADVRLTAAVWERLKPHWVNWKGV